MALLNGETTKGRDLKSAANNLRNEGREAVTHGYMDVVVGAGMWCAAFACVIQPDILFAIGAAAFAVTGYNFISEGNQSVKEGKSSINEGMRLLDVEKTLSEKADSDKRVEQTVKIEKTIKPAVAVSVLSAKQEKNNSAYVSGRGMFSAPAQKKNVDGEMKEDVSLVVAPKIG